MSEGKEPMDWQSWGAQWSQQRPENLEMLLKHTYMILPLLDEIDRLVFFIKDTEARYALVNRSFVQRLGHTHAKQILGLTSTDTFLINHGQSYLEQDRLVLTEGIVIAEKLELHVHQNGDLGWCLTYKFPIYDPQNRIIGLMGMSLDLASDQLNHTKTNLRLGKIEQYIREHLSEELRIQTLAQLVNMSVSQLERRLKKTFHMTPKQLIQKIRLEQAVQLLQSDHAIADIASACGYTDHSAFTRQFKQMTGVSPSQFKQSMQLKKRQH